MKEIWREALTEQQRKILNAACRDLSEQIIWHGFRLSLDDWRHMLSGTMLGWRMMQGIDIGDGRPAGLIMLGGSSLRLSKAQCIDAITMAFAIGDAPETQGLNCKPVRWCSAVCKVRWLVEDDWMAD